MFDPKSYAAELKDADAVVHSMGVIFEDERYKELVNGKILGDGPVKLACGVKDLVWRNFVGGKEGEHENPLRRTPENDKSDASAFERINRDSAVILAKAFSIAGESATEKPFVYISAEDHNRFAPSAYISSKRSAEASIDQISGLRSVYLRPGFMIDDAQSSSIQDTTVRDGLGQLLKLKHNLTSALGVPQDSVFAGSPVLSVQSVAKAAVEALEDESLRGPVGLSALHKYANGL